MTVQQLRMDLHQMPEVGFCEFETKQYILSVLKKLDCKIFEIGTGTVAFFDFEQEKTVGIRADIDGLPIVEDTGLAFASKRYGFMHACGHDSHTAMALTVAIYVDECKKQGKIFGKNVAFIFQPAEECDDGAASIVRSGVLQKLNLDHIFALHVWPELEKGKIYSKPGVMLAQVCDIDIILHGNKSHIADYYKGIDTMRAACEILLKLYEFEEECNKTEQCLLKFGKLESGNLRNITSDKTIISGSIRALSKEMEAKLQNEISAVVKKVAEKYNLKFEVRIQNGFPVVENDEKLFNKVAEKCDINLLDEPVLHAEDFSFFANVCPYVYFFLGIGDGMKLHHEKFDFDMNVLDIGVEFWKQLLEI
ncbi:MAG: amidohydrolase [Clostridiales bacterium]|nr:amidohydrolase [Clostridiales bacterium]